MKLYSFGMEHNFGDLWTQYAFQRWFEVYPEPVPPSHAEVFGVGSILADVPEGFTGDILGSGLMHGEQTRDLQSAAIWGVRGRLTAARIRAKEIPCFGDLVLLSHRLGIGPVPVRYSLGIVPHYLDRNHPSLNEWRDNPDVLVIDVQSGVDTVLRQIASCEQIVSSSLHGCVAADALHIPNAWVQLSDRVAGNGFKFQDYYSVFHLKVSPLSTIRYLPSKQWHRPHLDVIQAQLWAMMQRFAAKWM